MPDVHSVGDLRYRAPCPRRDRVRCLPLLSLTLGSGMPPQMESCMGKDWLAAGGLLSALGASTCCVLPLSLGTLGLGGTWLSTIMALATYEMAFRVVGILLLAAGFWLVYAPPKAAPEALACSSGSSARLTKTFLWRSPIAATRPSWMPMPATAA